MHRTKVLFVTASLFAAATACGGNGEESAAGAPGDSTELEGSVHLNASGGDLYDVWEDAWWGPFTDETGVEFTASSPADLSQLRAQVESGNVQWDLAEIETGGQYLQAVEQGLLTEFDREKFEQYFEEFGGDISNLAEGSIQSHGTWLAPYATILMFDERVFPEGGPQPDSVEDLWNQEEFPGPRCIHEQALYNYELALYADGVSSDDMYPLDVERAIAKLDELKPNIATFWRSGAEPIQLVANGECVMSTVWNGRPFGAQTEEGIDYFGVAFEGGMLHTSRLVIPKGAENVEEAYAAIAYYHLPEVGAESANAIGYGNANTAIADDLTEEAAEYVATTAENLRVLTVQSDEWWLEHGNEAEERFSEWRLEG